MALPEKYKVCREDTHKPTDLRAEMNGEDLMVRASCELCGADLFYEYWSPDWEALYDGGDCCDECCEAKPWCECGDKEPDED